jgi:heme/copper-type cytochrome/quinol oxidase subunit 4
MLMVLKQALKYARNRTFQTLLRIEEMKIKKGNAGVITSVAVSIFIAVITILALIYGFGEARSSIPAPTDSALNETYNKVSDMGNKGFNFLAVGIILFVIFTVIGMIVALTQMRR